MIDMDFNEGAIKQHSPMISVLMPTLQSEKNIMESIDSILKQTFTDFELIIIDDGSTDGTIDIIRSYSDPRIRLIQGPKKGLAEALNLGIIESKGYYIARIDSDDYSTPTRFEKQILFMSENDNVCMCGGWQQHFGTDDYVHKPPLDPNQCRTNLIFFCDMCHSTIMMKKEFMLAHDLFYSKEYGAEDFELWTRAMRFGDISNIQEIIGYYRHDENNITSQKLNELKYQQCEIVSKTLKETLGIKLNSQQQLYFSGYTDPFYDDEILSKFDDSTDYFEDLKNVLISIYEKNRKKHYYDEESLLKSICAEWYHLRYKLPFFITGAKNINDIFKKSNKIRAFCRKLSYLNYTYPRIKDKIRKITKTIFR